MKFENTYDEKLKKENGVFYTPSDIAKIMCERSKKFDDGNGIWLDPCCGLGILSITLATLQDDPINFILNRLIINEKDPKQLEIALGNFREKFGVVPKSFNEDFLNFDFKIDYIIMNPPYFKYLENDIYGYFLEKASEISKGFISINPISFTNSENFFNLRKKLLLFNSLVTYHFDNIPGHIFHDASVRVSIIVAHNQSNERKTTGIIRWKSENRTEMLLNIDNNLDDAFFTQDFFYKTIPNTTKYINQKNTLKNYIVSESNYPIYVTNSPRYFITAASFLLDRKGQIKIYMRDFDSYNKALIMLNSSYLYWWWRTVDSSMSLTKKTLLSLPWIDFKYKSEIIDELLNSEQNNKVYKKNAGKLQENIKHPKEFINRLNSIFLKEDLINLHN